MIPLLEEGYEELTRFERTVLELFVSIDEKLDRVLGRLGDKKLGDVLELMEQEPAPVNISASGMLFEERRRIEEGEFLKLDILIPMFPYFVIPVLARVVRVEERPGPVKSYGIAVEFKDIHEDDRETLIRYIMSRQREFLRDKRSKSSK